VDLRRVVDGTLSLNKRCRQWRLLPKSFGHWKNNSDHDAAPLMRRLLYEDERERALKTASLIVDTAHQ
jgi:hypothetical protein